jgi:enoyl-CoA hydratase
LQETRGEVALLTLNRPKALNALNDETMHEINAKLQAIDKDSTHNAIVITGNLKAFAGRALRSNDSRCRHQGNEGQEFPVDL